MSQEKELQSLKETYLEWIKAWNDLDANEVAHISWGNYGFGRDVPFVRNGAKDSISYSKGIQRYMDSMIRIDYQEYYTNYQVLDNVGLIDGYYAQTTQQKSGPLRTVYGRQSLVFIKRNGNWKIIHYHRSALPNEFTR